MKFLKQSLNVANACTILTASKQFDLILLLEACTNFILQNGKAVLESEGFKNLSKEAVVSIISNRNLHATEEEVFEAMMLYAEAVVARGTANGVDGVSDAFSDCLPHLRLDEMDHEFLCNRVKQTGLFSADALFEALSKIVDKHKTNNKRNYDESIKEGSFPQTKKRRIG